jgi:uncharacterized protein
MSEFEATPPATPEDAPVGLHFPCSFPIKATGRADTGDFAALVLDIVGRHAPGIDAGAVSTRLSSGGRWLAVTVTIQAQSREQLDAIYRDLSANERVVWAI